jgi:hypothetical protein
MDDRRELAISTAAITLGIIFLGLVTCSGGDNPFESAYRLPLGMSPGLFAAVVGGTVLAPVPYFIWHVLLLAHHARSARGNDPLTPPRTRFVGYILFLLDRANAPAPVRRSKIVALVALAYVLIVTVGWIIAAELAGI